LSESISKAVDTDFLQWIMGLIKVVVQNFLMTVLRFSDLKTEEDS